VSEAETTLLRAGGESPLLEDFRAVLEATTPDGGPRHAPYPTMDWLARFIVGQSGGPHKDAPLYELMHLTNAIYLAAPSDDSRALFFLSPGRITASYAKNWFQSKQAQKLVAAEDDIILSYRGEQTFSIRYGRIANLAALYEFLCGMDGYSFYSRFEDICQILFNKPDCIESIKSATNALSSEMRQYRRRYLDTSRADGKFNDLFCFLQARSKENQISVNDAAILDFWLLHNFSETIDPKQVKDYRGYRTVFDLFITFMDALRDAGGKVAVATASPLGTDRNIGEIDVASSDVLELENEEWSSPLVAFDHPPLKTINYFKKASERNPMESLMRFGPKVLDLPLAFLRYEIFGQVQSGITNDLQVGRGTKSVAHRITCADAETYDARKIKVQSLLQHTQDMSKATLHAIAPQQSENVLAFPIHSSPETLFRKTNRKGFEDFGRHDDEDRRNAFRIAAEQLALIHKLLSCYLDKIDLVDRQESSLHKVFETDRETFSNAFGLMYGDRT